ncbi:N-acetyl sugar amidotransferase [Akkermansiaceae bacterium]|nr:N-acetyl sugar amidotransferase [Akkermansiaceae bacterium]
MEQCKKCLYTTDHPFGLTLTEGLCSGCITHHEKYTIDWEEKCNELLQIIKSAKSHTGTYNCVVPVVGDAEDYYVVSKVLELGLNPLIVSVNSYFLNDIGHYNFQNLITYFDLDSWFYNPEIQTYKELIRTSLRKYNHMYLPWIQLHTSFPVHVAKEKKIPLIIWGGNQAVEQVGKFSHHDRVEMSSWSRVEHDLFGSDIASLMGNGAQVNERKINFYHYPKVSELGKNAIGIYLSNYMLWDPLKQNHSTLKFGFKPEKTEYTFDPFERAGSSVYYGIHDLLKFERCGYRKVSDQITREVRHRRIDSKEARLLVDSYSKQKLDKLEVEKFFNWLGVTKSGFDWFLMHKLNRSKSMILDDISGNTINFNFPKDIQELVSVGEVKKKSYLMFSKNIQI